MAILFVVQRRCERVEVPDDVLGQRLRLPGPGDQDEVVTADVAREPRLGPDSCQRLGEQTAGGPDGLVAAHEAVIVVVGLEIVEVCVEDGERGVLGVHHLLELVRDLEVAREAGEG